MRSSRFKPSDRLKATRKANGYKSAASFCEENGINYATYAAHEAGFRNITKKAAMRYAELLDISSDWLLTGREPNEPVSAPLQQDKEKDVLLVEDDPIIQKTIETFLLIHGHSTQIVKSVSEAMECINTYSYKLIFVDLGLPDSTGISLVENIRSFEHERHKKDTPIIVITSHAGELTRDCSLHAGANEFVVKPLKTGIIKDIIDKYIK